MKLLRMPNPNCLLYSAAMVMDVPPDEIIKMIGHDGQEVWWPDQFGNQRLRGIHDQEIVDVAFSFGWAVILIEPNPSLTPALNAPSREIYSHEEQVTRFKRFINQSVGVFKGRYIAPGYVQGGHAVAWDGSKLLDPNGFCAPMDVFAVRTYLMFRKID